MTSTPKTESDEDLLFLMSNVFLRHTGLPLVVWIAPRDNAQHSARLKVSLRPNMVPSEMISVTIGPSIEVIGDEEIGGRDFKLLREWIESNRDVLIQLNTDKTPMTGLGKVSVA